MEVSVSREDTGRPGEAGSDLLVQWEAIEARGKEEDVLGLPLALHIPAAPIPSSLLVGKSRQMTATSSCSEGGN